jgi:L-ascorbate metabolism protein UlaG (beta-lactamase superfamily)
MTVTTDGIHWLGHDSFRLEGSVTVYIDPWELAEGQPTADVILVTHDHFDHLSLPDIDRLSGPETVVVGPSAVTAHVRGHDTVTLAPGRSAEVRGVKVTAVHAYNTTKFRQPGQVYHPRDDDHVGYVVELDGRRVYHAGDTDLIPEMDEIRCDVALIPVSGTFVMTADEAALACGSISAAVVVPMHYAKIVGDASDAERLGALCGARVVILPNEHG